MNFECKNCKKFFERKYVYLKPKFCSKKCFYEYIKKNGFDYVKKKKRLQMMLNICIMLPKKERSYFINMASKIYGFSREHFYKILKEFENSLALKKAIETIQMLEKELKSKKRKQNKQL